MAISPSVSRLETKIVVHDSLCEALQAMEIIHLDPWASGVGTLANLTASSLAQDGNPRSDEFGGHANWAPGTGPMNFPARATSFVLK